MFGIHSKQVKVSDINKKHSLKWPNKYRLVIERGVKKALSNRFKKPRCRPLLVEGLSGGSAFDAAEHGLVFLCSCKLRRK